MDKGMGTDLTNSKSIFFLVTVKSGWWFCETLKCWLWQIQQPHLNSSDSLVVYKFGFVARTRRASIRNGSARGVLPLAEVRPRPHAAPDGVHLLY